MSLQAILAAMADVCNGVSSIGTAYALPPEVAPGDALLPAVVFAAPEGEFAWAVSQDDRRHAITMNVLVKRGGNLQTDYASLLPIFEDVTAAFRTQQRLGLTYVYQCQPEAYRFEGMTYGDGDDSYLGVAIDWAVKEKAAATFS